MNTPCKTYLYRAKNADGKLLYIGITQWPEVRMDTHAKSSAWHPLATDIEYFEYPDQAQARAAEVAEIKMHCPPYNVNGNPDLNKPTGSMMISYRVPPVRWQKMTNYKNSERTSLQAVIDAALTEYFERRGLPF